MSRSREIRQSRNKRGQSLIEFVIMSLVYFTFFFMTVRMAINYVTGHYVHYATYVAARALFAGGQDDNSQITAARQTLVDYLGEDGNRFGLRPNDENGGGAVPGAFVGGGPEYRPTGRGTNNRWQYGVTYSFKQRLYLMPLIEAAARRAGNGELSLTSESWLGKEVRFVDCDNYMTGREGRTGSVPPGAPEVWMYDNGC